MKDQHNEHDVLKSVAREKMLHEIRSRARELRKDSDSTATWCEAERDRADLLGLYDLLEDKLLDAQKALVLAYTEPRLRAAELAQDQADDRSALLYPYGDEREF